MTHSHDKKGKKHPKGTTPKKSKNKKDKKKDDPKKMRSTTKLSARGSKASLKHYVKKETSHDALVPSTSVSDTAVNYFNEQGSTPTTMTTKKMEETAHSPTTVPVHQTPLISAQTPSPAAPVTAMSPPPAPPAVSAPVVSAAPTTPPAKWKCEDVALAYIKQLDASLARPEFAEACQTTQISNIDKDCQIWKKNLMKNQSDAYPVPDCSLVKVNNSPDDYVNISSVIVPHCRYPVLMGQMPKKGCEEEFWKVTFQESVTMMYILKGSDDEKCDFFPTNEGGYVYYGVMFVNNRKAEKIDDERSKYLMEILPNGFSNSILVTVFVHTGWEQHGVPVKYANTTRSAVDVMNFVKASNGSEKLMVISRNGIGRAGFFLSLCSTYCCLHDLSEPRIVEIVKAIRLQRPNAVSSLKQYASLYLCLVYYIKKKTTIPEGMKQKVEDVTKELQAIIKDDVSIMY